MTTVIHYATSCEVHIFTRDLEVYIWGDPIKTLADALDLAEKAYANELSVAGDRIERISIIDAKTGELLAECLPDENGSDDDRDWSYNEDEGFDPYLGCYTDDC